MKNKLRKIVWVILTLVLCLGSFVPAATAAAEELSAEEVYTEDGDAAWEEEIFEDSEEEDVYEIASSILEQKLYNTGMSLNADQRVYDFFGKFSVTEIKEITEWIEKKEEESGISIRVFVSDMEMDQEKYFLEECTDRLCDSGYAKEDLAIMLLNLDYFNRGVCIQGYGLCETRLNDDRIEYVLDDIIECFSEDDYVYGVKLFATEAAYYADSTNYYTYFKDNSFEGKLKRMPWAVVVIAPLGIALVGILIMKSSNGGKMTTTGKTYIQSDGSCLTAKKDDYVRTSVSKTYSPRSSGSSGSSGGRSSGGGGRSSGGRSHSGGSRRF